MKVQTIVALALTCFVSTASADSHVGKLVGSLFPGDTNRDCVFFTLVGVTTANAANANVPWFAIPRSHPNYREQYAMLLAARVSGTLVNVATTGTQVAACGGHAEVHYVEMAAP